MTLPGPDCQAIINTGPLIACHIATGDWSILAACGLRLAVPDAVWKELQAGPIGAPGHDCRLPSEVAISTTPAVPHHLSQVLDAGEASVVAMALQHGVSWVVIDELAGRRVARLHGLQVTGSLGLVLCACRNQPGIDFDACATAMIRGGIHLSRDVLERARSLLR